MNSSGATETTHASHLRCEYLVNPLGIDELAPRLSWQLATSRRGARQTHYRVRVASSPAKLARGEADLALSKLSRTLARTQIISFSQPYLTLNHALLLNRVKFAQFARDRALPEVVRGFTGTIGVIAKSSFSDYAKRNFTNAKVQEYPGWGDVLKALERGEIIGAYRDEFEVKRILKIDPTASLVLRTVTFKDLEDTLGIAVGINDPVLLAFINEFLSQRSDKLTTAKVLAALEK